MTDSARNGVWAFVLISTLAGVLLLVPGLIAEDRGAQAVGALFLAMAFTIVALDAVTDSLRRLD